MVEVLKVRDFAPSNATESTVRVSIETRTILDGEGALRIKTGIGISGNLTTRMPILGVMSLSTD